MRACLREGCPAVPLPGFVYCTLVCREIDKGLQYAEKLCRRNPSDAGLTDRWTSLVEAGDAWSAYRATVIRNDIATKRRR